MEETAYYLSPIGWVSLKSEDGALLSATFLEEHPISIPPVPAGILAKTVAQLTEYFAGTRRAFDLLLSPKGTSFQLETWEQLLKIPYGKTLSYKALAIKVGSEKHTRAVGTANGSNPLGIIIPCHRVIGNNGELTGYAGGIWRKKWLLDHEAKYSGKPRQLSLF